MAETLACSKGGTGSGTYRQQSCVFIDFLIKHTSYMHVVCRLDVEHTGDDDAPVFFVSFGW